MTIQEIKIVGDNIVITCDSTPLRGTILIDTLDNVDNMYSSNNEEHSYVIEDANISGNTILIAYKALSPELDTSAFIVNVNGTMGFYYDEEELYNKEIDLLTNYCSTCLDLHLKERMVLFIVREQLLNYAKLNGKLEDQVLYYIDLARMLGIDFKYKVTGLCSGKCKRCITCFNNCCSLC